MAVIMGYEWDEGVELILLERSFCVMNHKNDSWALPWFECLFLFLTNFETLFYQLVSDKSGSPDID